MGVSTKLKDLLDKNDRFLLISHIQPDGDSLGSMLAFGEALENLGKTVQMVSKDKIPLVFEFLDGQERVQNDFLIGNYDVIILIDNGDLKRTGFPDRLQKARNSIPIINVDHHTRNDIWKLATVNLAKEEASSTAELVFDVFKLMGYEITPRIATHLVAGIFNDTGGFRHSNTSDKVFKIVAELLNKGGKLRIISESVSNRKPFSTLKLWGIALNRLVKNEFYGIVYSILLREDIDKLGASDEEVSGLVNLMGCASESKISLLIYETSDGKIKGSLRTEKDNTDVSLLANLLGGGGHKKASGFSLDGKIKRDNDSWSVV